LNQTLTAEEEEEARMNRYSSRLSEEILEESADKVDPIHVNHDWTTVMPINNNLIKFDRTVGPGKGGKKS
jgi:hypothetical protein